VNLLLMIFARITHSQLMQGDIEQLSDHRNNNGNDSSSSFRARDKLVFNHNPKAGGGSILDMMNDLRSHRIDIKDDTKLSKLLHQEPNRNSRNSYFYISEKNKSTKAIRRQGYIIGSIREPCSQYVSLWAYGSAKHGGLHAVMVNYYNNHTRGNDFKKSAPGNDKLSNFYGQDAPFFNTSKDIERFHRWMYHPLVHGRVGQRVKKIYSTTNRDDNIDGVDCYVYVEQFQSSLIDCLQKFEAQGGYIDWSTPLIASMLDKVNNNDDKGRRIVKKSKNDALGNPQVFHHAPCTTYFHNASFVQELQNGDEKFIFDNFGYKGCCSKEFRKN